MTPASISPKVTAASLASAVATILVWALSLLGVDVPAAVASAVVALLTFGAGYLVTDPLRQTYPDTTIEPYEPRYDVEPGADA